MIVNGREVRELWLIQFLSKRNEGGKTIKFVDIVAGVKVWAVTGDESIEVAKRFAADERLPWISLRGVTPLDIVESHIWNQPKVAGESAQKVQPFRGDLRELPSLTDLPPVETPDATAIEEQEPAVEAETEPDPDPSPIILP